MARTDTLGNFLTDVADAIRTKAGTSEPIQASSFDTAIENIPSGGGTQITTFAEFDEQLKKDADNLLKNQRLLYNTPNAIYNTPKTLYTPDADYKTYVIRFKTWGDGYDILWFPTGMSFGRTTWQRIGRGYIYAGDYPRINGASTNLTSYYRYYYNNNETVSFYLSTNIYNSLQEAVEAICSPDTQYNDLTQDTYWGVNDLNTASGQLTTNSTFMTQNTGDNIGVFQINEVSADETIEVIE